jgi:hypothetical protein
MKLRKEPNYLNGLFWQKGIKNNALIRGGVKMSKYKTTFLVAVAVLAFSFVSAGNANGSNGLDPDLVKLKKIAIEKRAEAIRCQTNGRHQLEATRRAEKRYVWLRDKFQKVLEYNERIKKEKQLKSYEEQARNNPKVRKWIATHSTTEWEAFKRNKVNHWWNTSEKPRIKAQLERKLKKRKDHWEHFKKVLRVYKEEFKEAKSDYLKARKKYFDFKKELTNKYNIAKREYFEKRRKLQRYKRKYGKPTWFIRQHEKELANLKRKVNDAAERCGEDKVYI